MRSLLFCSAVIMWLGDNWYSDHQETSLFWKDCQGAMTSQKWRNDIMEDWGKRWGWLK